jgi:vacuolar protein 8
LKPESLDGRSPIDDYSAFNDVWDKPEGGMHKYLYRFLTSPDTTFQHIAVWTIVQLLESGGLYMILAGLLDFDSFLSDPQLISNIRGSTLLIPNIKTLAQSRTNSPPSSVGTPRSHHSHQSYQETETNDGQGEIQILSRRIVEFIELDDLVPSSVPGSQVQPGSSVASEHDELRRSVREAFAPGSHR